MIEFKNSKGEILQFDDNSLSKGGEGTVYKQYDELGHGDIGDLAKIFHEGKADSKEEKIKAMISIQAPMPSSSFAWPKEVLYDIKTGEFRGYVMYMKFNKEELGRIYSYDSKYRSEKDWGFYINVAKSLAKTITGIHKINQVVGDLNDKNVLVDVENAQITLIDNDSFHITLNSVTHRCSVGMGEYIAPEIQGVNFREGNLPTFTKYTDNFSLAILIFKLLMNGMSPFNSATIDEKSIEENIKNGCSPFFKSENKGKPIEPSYTPPMDILPPNLYNLFKLAFNDSLNSPQGRPTAQDFYIELDSLSKNLKICAKRGHKYPSKMNCCPWCFVDEKMYYLNKNGAVPKLLTFKSYSDSQKKSTAKSQSNMNQPQAAPNTITTKECHSADENYGDFSTYQHNNSVKSQTPFINMNSPDSVKKQITQPMPVSAASKAMTVLGCIGISILTIASGIAGFVLSIPFIPGIFAIIMTILSILSLPKINFDYTYNSIVEFPSYITVKCKEKNSIWYVVVSKFKVILFDFFSLAVIISLFVSIIMVMKSGILWSLISFALLAVFSVFFITEKRTLWKKTALGIIIGVISIITVIMCIILFANLALTFVGIDILTQLVFR